MTKLNITDDELKVLKYVERNKKPVSKTSIGEKVGKKPVKSAARWANPIIESLLEKNLIQPVKVGFRTFYTVEKVPQAMSTNEIQKEFDNEQPDLELSSTKNNKEFDYKKARREISKIIEQKLVNKREYDSKGSIIGRSITEWQNSNEVIPEKYFQKVVRFLQKKYNPRPETPHQKTTLLERINQREIYEKAEQYYKDHIEHKAMSFISKKRAINRFLRNILQETYSEKSMRANLVKSFMSRTSYKILTGKDKPIKNDGRPFIKGQRVKYKNKHGEIKTGVIQRVYVDKASLQRTIIVKPDDSDKTEMKIDRKIIAVIS